MHDENENAEVRDKEGKVVITLGGGGNLIDCDALQVLGIE